MPDQFSISTWSLIAFILAEIILVGEGKVAVDFQLAVLAFESNGPVGITVSKVVPRLG